MRISPEQSCLIIVDVQAKLAAAIAEYQRVIERCEILMRAADRLAIPILVCEENPAGLGPTVAPLAAMAPSGSIMPKMAFSAASEPAISARVAALGRTLLAIAGMEAHVCVLQTALGFVDQGYRCALVADAVGSRHVHDRDAAIARMRGYGVEIVTAEMIVFEWLGTAAAEAFRDILHLVK